MRRTLAILSMTAAAAWLLAACGERPQTASGSKADAAPYSGTTAPAYAAAQWPAGDRNAWAQQLRARTQYGQNEYSRPSGTHP